MARKQPIAAPEDVAVRNDNQMITQVREYKLITPLFGGGVEPGEADPITVIRATEIRGQLRFWWRATRGGQFEDTDENRSLNNHELLVDMHRREENVWGGASQPNKEAISKVQISVEIMEGEKITKDHPFEVYQRNNDIRSRTRPRNGSAAPPYAAFPLQPSDADLRNLRETEETKAVSTNVKFKLTISFPEIIRQDVEAALWAWETFGGIGARTRRGFGVPLRMDVPSLPLPQSAKQFHETQVSKYINKGRWPDHVPHLSKNPNLYRLTFKQANNLNPWSSPQQAWHSLITALKEFRQQRPNKQINQNGRWITDYGQSQWPEPDSIRRAFPRADRRHVPREHLAFNKYPRAAFGLPIVIHFKDADDPADVTIQGRTKPEGGGDYDRLASPLILRPLAFHQNDVQVYLGLATVLESARQPPGGLAIKRKGSSSSINVESSELSPEEAAAITIAGSNKPLLGTETNVLIAFLAFLKGQ